MGARQTTTAVANGGQTSYASGSSMSASGGRSAPMPVQSHPSPIPGASTSSSLSGLSFGLQHQGYHRFLNRSNTPTSRHTDAGSYGRQSNPNSDDSSPDDTPLNRFLLTHFFSLRDIKCPACRKPIPSDDIECHLVTCLSKPLISYNEDILTEDKGECSICLDDLKAGQTIARLPCLCIYHKNCIDEWFQVKRSCPEHPND